MPTGTPNGADGVGREKPPGNVSAGNPVLFDSTPWLLHASRSSGQMLFSGEEGLKPTDALSGGETARLLFCRLMLLKPNVLILDEPTNHLDLEAINALNIALQKYEGTVLLVTHDEDLLEEVGTRVWQFDRGRIVDFKGTYEELTASLA